MGLFKKRSGMIDVVDMQKRGMVKVPERKVSNIKADKNGFVELKSSSSSSMGSMSSSSVPQTEEKKSSGGFFDFFGGGSSSTSTTSSSDNSFSTEANGYDKREVDAKIENLDNKIYKLEQRIEVLERKTGVGFNNNPTGGW